MSKHLPTTTWPAYLDGALSPAMQADAERHLAECAACRAELEKLHSLRQQLAKLSAAPQATNAATERAWAAVRPRLKPSWRAWLQPAQRLVYGLGATAAMILFVLGLTALIKQQANITDPQTSMGQPLSSPTSDLPAQRVTWRAVTPTPTCHTYPLPTGERFEEITILDRPSESLHPGQAAFIRFSGGYVFLNTEIICGDEIIGRKYEHQFDDYDFGRTVRLMLAQIDGDYNKLIAEIECGRECLVEFSIPADTLIGAFNLQLNSLRYWGADTLLPVSIVPVDAETLTPTPSGSDLTPTPGKPRITLTPTPGNSRITPTPWHPPFTPTPPGNDLTPTPGNPPITPTPWHPPFTPTPPGNDLTPTPGNPPITPTPWNTPTPPGNYLTPTPGNPPITPTSTPWISPTPPPTPTPWNPPITPTPGPPPITPTPTPWISPTPPPTPTPHN